MTTWKRTAGDVGDTIVAYLYGVTGAPSSSVSHVWQGSGTATNLTSTTVVGADPSGLACLVHTVQLGSWLAGVTPSSPVAEYLIEHEVTFADGRVLTWPSENPDSITVRRAGG